MGPHESFAESLAADALESLRFNWGDAYVIEQTGPETWLAARRDGQGAVHANDAAGLLEKISADYTKKPVPRLEAQ